MKRKIDSFIIGTGARLVADKASFVIIYVKIGNVLWSFIQYCTFASRIISATKYGISNRGDNKCLLYTLSFVLPYLYNIELLTMIFGIYNDFINVSKMNITSKDYYCTTTHKLWGHASWNI